MKNIAGKIYQILRTQKVLDCAFVCMVVSMFWVPPSLNYLKAIDWRVLALLFSLMLVIAALERQGVFRLLAQKLLMYANNQRSLVLILVLLTFVSSMFITNDVALITFVPFAILLLQMVNLERNIAYVVVLQTIAANTGSMLTPLGNPQNLYLYNYYQYAAGEFIWAMLPLTLVCLVALIISCLAMPSKDLTIDFAQKERITDKKLLGINLFLFGLCILSVLRILPYYILVVIIIAAMAVSQRDMFIRVDYSLLGTFVCFFIFVGNLQEIPQIAEFLKANLADYPLALPIVVSQIISNVPAALLLCSFADNGLLLLWGVNIGGLGTLIASMASLISYKYFVRFAPTETLHYMKLFTIANIIGLIVLIACGMAVLKIM